jgi:uncharacterized protein
MDFKIIFSLIIFLGIMGTLVLSQKKKHKFTTRVFMGMALGIIFGGILQQSVYLNFIEQGQLIDILGWMNIVGTGYMNLLRLIVQPLVLVSILSAIVNLDTSKNVTKIASTIIVILVGSAMVAGAIGVATTTIFRLDASVIVVGEAELAREEALNQRAQNIEEPVYTRIVNMIPSNIFADLAGQRPSSTLGIVIFASILGSAIKYLEKDKNKEFLILKDLINATNAAIVVMIDFVLIATPFGVFAIMSRTIALTNFNAIVHLAIFVIASYVGLFVIFAFHLLLLLLHGLNPIKFVKKSVVPLSFAFASSSSAATIPLNKSTQQEKLGVDEGIAAMSTGLGATIGQNGCAGLYPAMLAVMISTAMGEPITVMYVIQLLLVIGITSFGVAGVGGGATYASIIVLTTLGLPISLAAVLISVEPFIGMGRTVTNVSNTMVAGIITAKRSGLLDEDVYNS